MVARCPKCGKLTVRFDLRNKVMRCFSVDCSWIGTAENRGMPQVENKTYISTQILRDKGAEPSLL